MREYAIAAMDHKALGTAENSYSAEVPTRGTVLVKVSK